MQNILIRADSSSTIGTGHIMRDLVLADQFHEANVIFAAQALPGNINYRIEENGYKVELLHSNEPEELIALIQQHSIEMIIIDHYGIDYRYEKLLKEKTGVKIFVLDDTYEKHHCDILLNHNIGADKTRYKGLVPEECLLKCGAKHTLLRSEFTHTTLNPRTLQNKTSLTAFIAMGGTDNININTQILEKLRTIENLQIIMVSTTANRNLHHLQTYIETMPNVELHVNSNKIAELMNRSDFAIITPSVTVNEVCFMRLPFIAVKTVDNQKEVFDYLKKSFLALNYHEIDQLNDKIASLLDGYPIYLEKIQKELL